jgi:hypothetical protein
MWQKKYQLYWQVLALLATYKIVFYGLAFLLFYFTKNAEPYSGTWLSNMTCQWDCLAFREIAQQGYTAGNAAFYPLYPALLALLSAVFGLVGAQVLLMNAALYAGLLALYKLARLEGGKRAAWRSVFYLLIWPSAFFLSTAYTEALFLALALWAFYYAKQGQWPKMAALGLLAGLSRIEGQVLMIALLIEYLAQKKWDWRQAKIDIAYCFSPALGLAIFMLYLWWRFDDPWLFATAQANWGKHFAWPWETISLYWRDYVWAAVDSGKSKIILARLDFFSFVGSLAAGLWLWWRKSYSYAVYIILAVLLVTFTGDLISTNRRQLLYFPIFLLLGRFGKNRQIDFIITVASVGLLVVSLYRWVNGQWIG